MKIILMALFSLIMITDGTCEVITHGIAERGLFFYKCHPGEVKVNGKCIKIQPEEPEQVVVEKAEEPVKLQDEQQKIKEQKVIQKEINVDASTYEYPITEEAKRIPALRNFLTNPNDPKNVENYLGWVAKHYNYVANIGYQIQSTVNMKGDNVYPVSRSSTSPLGSVYASQEEDEKIQELLTKHQRKIGILYFYKLGCPSCSNMKPIISLFRQKYPYISFRAVTNSQNYDNDYGKMGIKSYMNIELIQQLGISQTPTILGVVEQKDGSPKYAGLATSFTPLDQIEKQLIRMLINEGVIKATALNPNRSEF